VLAVSPMLFAAPAHAALIDYADVQITFYDVDGHTIGFDDLALLGAGDTAAVTVPAGSRSAEVTNDLFPLSDAPITVTIETGTAIRPRTAGQLVSVSPGREYTFEVDFVPSGTFQSMDFTLV
jgi:hypothetical protein